MFPPKRIVCLTEETVDLLSDPGQTSADESEQLIGRLNPICSF
jgi:hypothetical protein